MNRSEKWLLIISILLLIIDFGIIILSNLTPKIILNKGDMKIALNEIYKEPGYHAFKGYFDITDQIKITNKVNNKKTGTYTITYSIKEKKKEYKIIRHITVEDRIEPNIELKGQNPAIVCPNKEYEEEGFLSIDNYDGDITKQVLITKEKDFILYSVSDKAGNKKEIKRKIEYQDTVAPTITLTGGNAYSLYQGGTYKEPGYQATDNCNGDITNQVKIIGNVNTNKVGSYQLTYEVTDEAGNSVSTSRSIIVMPKPKPKPTNGKVIYLTFDDGPSANITPALLDILKEENVKATFFVLNHGSNLDYLIQREHNEGHTVALHGSSHNYRYIYSSSEAFWTDLSIIEQKVKSLTGVKPTIIRFPGGGSNTVSRFTPGIMSTLAREAKEKGYHYFDWNIGSGDSGEARTAEQVYQNVINGLGNKNNVILMHDFSGNYKTLNAIKNIIHYGKQNGYTFERITNATPEIHHRVAN